jgi:Cdc6-like AAA superfamily ATPase
VDIVRDRLRSVPGIVEPRAVDLAARRVAGGSGDLRRVLSVLRHALALWLAAPQRPPAVTLAHVSKALQAASAATHLRVRTLPPRLRQHACARRPRAPPCACRP